MSAECPPSLQFAQAVVRDLTVASRKEWLLTNGIGGFACGTVAGVRTRRYHGLLTAALPPPVGRVLVLAEIEAWVQMDSRSYPISTHLYQGAIHPNGIRYLQRFGLHPCPTHLYMVERAVIQRQVWLVPQQDAVIVRYTMRSGRGTVRLHLVPLFACRDYHALTHANSALNPHAEQVAPGVYRLTPYPGFPAVFLQAEDAQFIPHPDWYYAFHYPVEQERGLDNTEDLWTPGVLVCDLQQGESVTVAVSLEPLAQIHPEPPEPQAVPPPFCEHPLASVLWCAAEQFVIRRPQGTSIVAGYPWFTDWGRDAMISLRGILLVRERYTEAREVLDLFARYMRDGLIPNRFPDAGEEPEYNTADATLWFAWMGECYRQQTGDDEFFRDAIYPRLKECLSAYQQGTRFGIRIDPVDSILRVGEPGWQVTWMDARIGDYVVTPREGKPVEIAALWLQFLQVLADSARRYDDTVTLQTASRLLQQVREAFMRTFWIPELRHLADVVDDAGRQDPRLRPNQLLALAISQPPVSREMARQILHVVGRHLLTPYGLRTLAPFDPEYRGRYEGDVYSRDSAYHQGTVWTWLLGPYADALIFAFGDNASTLSRVRSLLKPFEKHLRDAGLGTVSEIFDGDPPHHPRGCFAQAWSVAELLRIWHRTHSQL
ncbi:MAG: glycogen debranching enzyme N-terminal domain-containing protein [Chthonomonadetes bacterium]|nr:glycogen debranching enzyme N-terminal domain-containing protein [Chthonomonadetes bacterium]